jgi:hypothetical protein
MTQNKERYQAYLDCFIKSQQVMGKTITPEQQYEFAKYTKASGATLSDRFKITTGVLLAQEMGGATTGVSVDQLVKQVIGGFQRNQHSAAKSFVQLGLANNDDFEQTGADNDLRDRRRQGARPKLKCKSHKQIVTMFRAVGHIAEVARIHAAHGTAAPAGACARRLSARHNRHCRPIVASPIGRRLRRPRAAQGATGSFTARLNGLILKACDVHHMIGDQPGREASGSGRKPA